MPPFQQSARARGLDRYLDIASTAASLGHRKSSQSQPMPHIRNGLALESYLHPSQVLLALVLKLVQVETELYRNAVHCKVFWERGPGFRAVSKTQGMKTQRELDLGHTTTTMGEQQRKTEVANKWTRRLFISIFGPERPSFLSSLCCICLWRSSSPPRPCRCQPGAAQLGARRRATWPTAPLRGTTLDGYVRGEKAKYDRRPSRPIQAHSCWAARTKCNKCNNRGQP